MTLTVRAAAKINLLLGVGAPRPDGFHTLVTVYQAVSLYDDLTVNAPSSGDGGLTVQTEVASYIDASHLPAPGLNIVDRAAAALAAAYLASGDRAGVVAYGGVVRWLTPASGNRQLLRIVETVIETEILFSYVWRRIDLLPARTIPPQSLVAGAPAKVRRELTD